MVPQEAPSDVCERHLPIKRRVFTWKFITNSNFYQGSGLVETFRHTSITVHQSNFKADQSNTDTLRFVLIDVALSFAVSLLVCFDL